MSFPRWYRFQGSFAIARATMSLNSGGTSVATTAGGVKSSWTILYEIAVRLSPWNGLRLVNIS